MGVWIETTRHSKIPSTAWSHPVWVCGLKLLRLSLLLIRMGHTLYGCVD